MRVMKLCGIQQRLYDGCLDGIIFIHRDEFFFANYKKKERNTVFCFNSS